MEPGKGIDLAGRVPENAEFFQDHFPDFPVLPGVLAVDILKRSAECYLSRRDGAGLSPAGGFSLKSLRAVKFAHYLRPGDCWQSRLELVSQTDRSSEWKGQILYEGRVAVTAKLVLGHESRTAGSEPAF
jgi:3-hydroxyacyl-[acyl-carrier-protein] dehydratase